jgi:hypothetical protein
MSDSIANIGKLCGDAGLPDGLAFKMRIRILIVLLGRAQAVLSFLLSDKDSISKLKEHSAGKNIKELYRSASESSALLATISSKLD